MALSEHEKALAIALVRAHVMSDIRYTYELGAGVHESALGQRADHACRG